MINALQRAKELGAESEFTPFRAVAGSYASIPNLYNASRLIIFARRIKAI